ncbi:hypothetical protein TUSST3_09510 [Streptomyces sp. TUS-ST3]|uniref:hypothetical protein n=1 Tax=Streptomyces sp. TUS-ST3 TaxID=3025591 RepID=UPI0024E0DC85|nr:hypothetical protein [Streptomyces sp. TUS-ST3]GLP64331.1 hypothetical protein TUSST3_09510 [Streptomyces sp. TUS-ST3]
MSEEITTPEAPQPEVETPEAPTPEAKSEETPKAPEGKPGPLDALLATLDDDVKLALLNEGGKKALLAEREAAKAARRDRDAALTKVQEYERAKLSEQERLTADLGDAQKQAQEFRRRAVRSEVRALAANSFADPDDAAGALDLDDFINDSGDIDEQAIRSALDGLLERKPHWAKTQPPEGPRRPAPDRTQASGANKKQAPSPRDEFAGWLSSKLT